VVSVEAGQDLCDRSQVPVEELDQSAAVVDGSPFRASTDEQRETRDAERVLDVDGEQT
jgi:hypothetical protein